MNPILKELSGIDEVTCPYCQAELAYKDGDVISGFFCSECEEYIDPENINPKKKSDSLDRFIQSSIPCKNLMDEIYQTLALGV